MGTDGVRTTETRHLFEHWDRLRGLRAAPARADIAPDAIAPLLASTFLLDAGAEPATFRLAGTRLGALFGEELTGQAFARLFRDDDRLLGGRVLRAVIDGGAIAIVDLHGEAAAGRSISLEMIMLPLADEPARVLGALNPTALPFWLGAYPVAPLSMTGVRIMDPDKDLFFLTNRPTIPLDRPRRTERAGRRMLRIIDGNAAMAGRLRHATLGDRPLLRVLEGGRDRKD